MIVRTENLTKNFGSVQALNGVSLEFGEGATGLLGPNGSGKTTLLRVLLGLIPANGTVEVLGMDPAREPREVRARVGYMPESECIIPGLTGIDVVAYLGRLSGMTRRDALQRAHEVMYYVGLDEERYRDANGYSQGMQQRLKLATALVHDPDLIFLDEPTNGLDPDGREEMLAVVGELATDHGKSIVLSSHLLVDVERLCKSVVMLDSGSVVKTGSIEELTADKAHTYEVTVNGPVDGFVDCLRRVGLTVHRGRPMLVDLPPGATTTMLFTAARDGDVLIQSLRRRRRSLEDVFIEMLEATDAG